MGETQRLYDALAPVAARAVAEFWHTIADDVRTVGDLADVHQVRDILRQS